MAISLISSDRPVLSLSNFEASRELTIRIFSSSKRVSVFLHVYLSHPFLTLTPHSNSFRGCQFIQQVDVDSGHIINFYHIGLALICLAEQEIKLSICLFLYKQ